MIKVKFGNLKLGNDVIVFNMSSSIKCPSRKLGLCKVPTLCYARKAELQYKEHVTNYRDEQEKYWLTHSKEEILEDIIKKISSRRTNTNYFRYNESGDFHSQNCIEKLSYIADGLKCKFDIITYGFSARKDLDFSKAKFLCKGSGFKANNGMSIVILKDDKLPSSFIECPATECKNTCNLCKINHEYNIAFRKH